MSPSGPGPGPGAATRGGATTEWTRAYPKPDRSRTWLAQANRRADDPVVDIARDELLLHDGRPAAERLLEDSGVFRCDSFVVTGELARGGGSPLVPFPSRDETWAPPPDHEPSPEASGGRDE